jgi:hypothetical protein
MIDVSFANGFREHSDMRFKQFRKIQCLCFTVLALFQVQDACHCFRLPV